MPAAVLVCHRDQIMQHDGSHSMRLPLPYCNLHCSTLCSAYIIAKAFTARVIRESHESAVSDQQTPTSMAMAPPCPRSGRVACAQSPTPLRQPSNQGSPGFTCLHMRCNYCLKTAMAGIFLQVTHINTKPVIHHAVITHWHTPRQQLHDNQGSSRLASHRCGSAGWTLKASPQ